LKAEGPSTEELERVERMKAELLSRSSEKSSSPLGSASSNSIGRYSLGLHKLSGMSPQGSKERRKSAGDQDMVKQLNMFVRTRTDSGKRLTDMVCHSINLYKRKDIFHINIILSIHIWVICVPPIPFFFKY